MLLLHIEECLYFGEQDEGNRPSTIILASVTEQLIIMQSRSAGHSQVWVAVPNELS